MRPREDIPYLLRARDSDGTSGAEVDALQEALCLPASLLTQLPLRSKFSLYSADLVSEIVVHNRELAEPREPCDDAVLLDGLELEALVVGVEAERFLAADLRQLCADKRAHPDCRLTREQALAGAQPVGAPVSFEALLRRLELTLVGLEVGADGNADDLTRAA